MNQEICYELQGHNHALIEGNSKNVANDITDEVYFEDTRKGGQFIVHKNHRFVQSSSNQDRIHYRCSFYTRKCRAKLSVQDEKVWLHSEHNHEP